MYDLGQDSRWLFMIKKHRLLCNLQVRACIRIRERDATRWGVERSRDHRESKRPQDQGSLVFVQRMRRGRTGAGTKRVWGLRSAGFCSVTPRISLFYGYPRNLIQGRREGGGCRGGAGPRQQGRRNSTSLGLKTGWSVSRFSIPAPIGKSGSCQFKEFCN